MHCCSERKEDPAWGRLGVVDLGAGEGAALGAWEPAGLSRVQAGSHLFFSPNCLFHPHCRQFLPGPEWGLRQISAFQLILGGKKKSRLGWWGNSDFGSSRQALPHSAWACLLHSGWKGNRARYSPLPLRACLVTYQLLLLWGGHEGGGGG